MSRLEFVAVTNGLQNADRLGVQLFDSLCELRGNRDKLARHRAAILHSRDTDVAGRTLQGSTDVSNEIGGGDIALLDPQEEMFARADRFVCGNFLDKEVFRVLLPLTAHAGKCGGEEGKLTLRSECGQSGVGRRLVEVVGHQVLSTVSVFVANEFAVVFAEMVVVNSSLRSRAALPTLFDQIPIRSVSESD